MHSLMSSFNVSELQNTNFIFHYVVERHYSDAEQNIYIILSQINSQQCQILLGSAHFYRRYEKNIWAYLLYIAIRH